MKINEKDKIDKEYQLIEEKVGQNAELINKAFNRILNSKADDKNRKKEEKNKNKKNMDEEELETDLNNLKENKNEGGICQDNNVVKNRVIPVNIMLYFLLMVL